MKSYRLSELDETQISRLCRRPASDNAKFVKQISPVLEAVKREGDRAVRNFTSRYDGVETGELLLDPASLNPRISKEEAEAIDRAIENVALFHKEQMRGSLRVETAPGVTCMREARPIERVGLYVPGGTAPLPSTAVMLGVPAAIAGCGTIVMATPPDKEGNIPDAIAYVAKRTGVTGILPAGGAQAIAAMAYGTESVPKVDKIFGPGNAYVTAAKLSLQTGDAMVSIDLPAGPSELLVIAGSEADVELVAADLLSQAEHGPDSQVVLVALDGFDLESFKNSLQKQLETLPRASTVTEALLKSFILTVGSLKEAFDFSNRYAPEHLLLHLQDAADHMADVKHAGSVFLGPWTPESLGDYASGTNHTLPTYGYARMYSGVSLDSFQKMITFQEATEEGIRELGPTVEILARMEGLHAHERAVSVRLRKFRRPERGSDKPRNKKNAQ